MRTNQYRNAFVQDAVCEKGSRATRRHKHDSLRVPKPRNPIAESDIMRKGGAHAVPKRDKHQKRQLETAMLEE